jgi:hypothetical protein
MKLNIDIIWRHGAVLFFFYLVDDCTKNIYKFPPPNVVAERVGSLLRIWEVLGSDVVLETGIIVRFVVIFTAHRHIPG